MRYFVISDVHGNINALNHALDTCGFKSGNNDHLLICNGDMFDRGFDSKAVFERINNIPNAIHIKGNHDTMLLEFFTDPGSPKVEFNYNENGMRATLASFADIPNNDIDMVWTKKRDMLRDKVIAMNPPLYKYLHELKDFYETKTHIIAHAGINTNPDVDWRETSTLQQLTWDRDFLFKDTSHINKVIVVGHTCVDSIRKELMDNGYLEVGIYDRRPVVYQNKVYIDGCAYRSNGQVNVYEFEE
jgi:predicted phosphodiesterase